MKPISVVPVGIVKQDEVQYEYDWFETISDTFFATNGFEEKYAQLSKQGFRVIDHSLLYSACEPIDYTPGNAALGETCEIKDLFLLEREKGSANARSQILVYSVPRWRGKPSVELSTQINEKLAAGFYPASVFSKFEILLEQTGKSDEPSADKPEVQVARSSAWWNDEVEKKVNELAQQGYRLALVSNEIGVMYRYRDSPTPVSYVWLNTTKKSFEKQLAQLQERGAIYRTTYPDRQGEENKLVFELKPVDDGKRREYRVLKFEFQAVDNAAEKKVQIDLAPSSKETIKLLNRLAREGFAVRDLFFSDKISVLLERPR